VPIVDSDQEHEWPDNLMDKGFMKFMCKEIGGPPNGFPETLYRIDQGS
jgi:nitrogenase subunit NifH